jgi:hypothetical protein
MAAFLFHHETTRWKLGCLSFLCGGSLQQHFLYASQSFSLTLRGTIFCYFLLVMYAAFYAGRICDDTQHTKGVHQRWARMLQNQFIWWTGHGALRSSDTTETNRSVWMAEMQRDLTKISGPEMTVHRNPASRLHEATALTSEWNW